MLAHAQHHRHEIFPVLARRAHDAGTQSYGSHKCMFCKRGCRSDYEEMGRSPVVTTLTLGPWVRGFEFRLGKNVVDRTRKKGKDRASYRGGIMAELVERGKKRQREEEKEEQAADAATERELKRRQDAMTLEEIREQVQEAEKKLAALVAERLQLFMQLEKVLREEEAQKRALEKEANN
ncbi:troponin I-like isoform X1 [Dermacentor silvarum]|uniref:troponin I-like isoform X1 n=1 Tax=Dermacentor silvarum TaxID=543639 RepID=UPI00210162E5|nr:troponin I-like isoform X1 [Dermacentor silvarum]